jgi:hypothetical protein
MWKWGKESDGEDHHHRHNDAQIPDRDGKWSKAQVMSWVVKADLQKSGHVCGFLSGCL